MCPCPWLQEGWTTKGIASVLGVATIHLRGETTNLGLPWCCSATCRAFLVQLYSPSLPFFNVYFANKRIYEFFSTSHHCYPSTDGNVIAAMWELRVEGCKYHVRLIPLACLFIPTLFEGVEDEMCGVRNSLDFAVGFSQIDPFPSRISRPSLESEPKVRTYSSACLAGFPGSLVGVDASIPSVSTVLSSWFRFLVSFHRSFLPSTMDGGTLLVSWKYLFVWVGFRSFVFVVWSISTDGGPCAMVGTRQPSLPST